jgi:L-serine/L-threonine ammonia-lyase
MESPLHIETPTYENSAMSARLNKRIWLKMECYQPVGSFKIRGIGALCQQAVANGSKRLTSSSGGNAGLAAAYAGRRLGVPVTIVVPETTSETARARMRAEGAEVVEHGAVWDEADRYARELVAQDEAAYIHPFDNPAIWTGHATMIHEAARQCEKPDVVVVAVGGGGLLSGIVEGMHDVGWADVPILAVETAGAASFAASVHAGKLVRLSAITSIAKTLGALQVTPQALAWSRMHEIQPAQVTDADAIDACLKFADDLRVVVEPACGAALSLLYRNSHYLDGYDSALVIVCGGAGATLADLLT